MPRYRTPTTPAQPYLGKWRYNQPDTGSLTDLAVMNLPGDGADAQRALHRRHGQSDPALVERFGQVGLQVLEPRPDPGFDRGETDPETRGHLGIAESGVVRERDGFVLECGQMSEAATQGVPLVVSHCLFGHHIGGGLIVATAPGVIVVHGGALVPNPVHGLAMGQHAQPGEYGTAPLVEPDRTAPHLEVDVVTGLFGIPTVTDDRQHPAIDQTASASVELSEGLLIAVADAMYQFCIDTIGFDINPITNRTSNGPQSGWRSFGPM